MKRIIPALLLTVTIYLTGQDQINLTDRATEISELTQVVRAKQIIDPQAREIVEGTYTVKTWWFAADVIIFKPGAKLVFTNHVIQQSRELYIVAGEIIIEGEPPTITWEKTEPGTPPDRGHAHSGQNGNGKGDHGHDGQPGTPGVKGIAGASAPNLTLVFRKLTGGALSIDFAGTAGGAGGKGQTGGNGGSGAQGSPARQDYKKVFGSKVWLPACKRGPGRGGNGGNGGRGGNGGEGGSGGYGGNVTLISLPVGLPTITQVVLVNVSGGPGGQPGLPGAGGQGGHGGPEGKLANFCNSAGRVGGPGRQGESGIKGSNGPQGSSGRTFVASITEIQFDQLFGY